MNIGNISIIALVVITVIEVIKDFYPNLTGNMTRLVALVIGAVLGYAATAGILPVPGLDWINGAIAGVAAVGGVTVADKVSGK